MNANDLGGSMILLLPDRLDPNHQEEQVSETMTQPLELSSESTANGALPSTSATPTAPAAAAAAAAIPSRDKPRPRKAPELASVERRNWLVHLHYVRGEFEECLALTKALLVDTRGMCEYANYVQALILRHQGKIHESLELFQLCNVLNPNSVQNLKQMARSLFLLGRHKRAVDAYRQAETKSEKLDWEIHYNLGVCYQRLGDLDAGKLQLEQALQLHRHHATFRALAALCLQQGDVTAAVATYRAAIEQFPENSDLHASLGKLLLQTGRPQQAFEQLGAALTFQPQHSPALLAVGSMMQGHQDFDVALAKYRVAAQTVPESAALWNNIAMCFFGKKKYVAAISCLKRANYLAPFEWRVLYNLGLVHLTMQQTTSAFHFLSAAVNLKPTKGHIFMLLAVTLSQLEDESNARLAYKQAVSLETKDPSVCLNYTVFLLRQGDREEAIKTYSMFEARVVKIRQNAELDPQVMEAGRKVAAVLGQDSAALRQKPGRTRLQPRADDNVDKDASVKDSNLQKKDLQVPEVGPPEPIPTVASAPIINSPTPQSAEVGGRRKQARRENQEEEEEGEEEELEEGEHKDVPKEQITEAAQIKGNDAVQSDDEEV